MKKFFYTGLFLICLAGCFYLLKEASRPNKEENGGPSPVNKPASRTLSPKKPILYSPPIAATENREPSLEGRPLSNADNLIPGHISPEQSPETNVVTHTAADFQKGEMHNMISENGLVYLGNDATPLAHPGQYRLQGLYTSSEESTAQVFDTIAVGYSASYPGTGPEDSAIIFEIRTRSAAGEWSPWHVVSAENLNQPLPVDSPSSGWQYRITLQANDPYQSPRLQSVTVATFNAPANPAASADRATGGTIQ